MEGGWEEWTGDHSARAFLDPTWKRVGANFTKANRPKEGPEGFADS